MRAARVILALAAALSMAPVAWGQDDEVPYELDAAITSLQGLLSVEHTLLAEDRLAFAAAAQRRRSVVARLTELQAAREIAVAQEGTELPATLERLSAQIDQLEGERAEVGIAERVLVETLRTRIRRIALLDEQLAKLEAVDRPLEGALTGRWEVALLPGAQRGTFELRQTGTVVTGLYRLSGGFTGSLRGTLVKTKVFLERIDSQLGRSMSFEAHISADGNMLRGTWRSYELADGETASSGQWSARRKTEE